MARVCLIYLGQKYKTLNVLNKIGLSWNIAEKKILPEIRSIEPVLRSIELGRKSLNTSTATQFQLYINAHILSESKQD